VISRQQILRRAACFKCGMRLNKLKCLYGCTDRQLKEQRDLALKIHRDIKAAEKRPVIFQIR
jgi:hypothetical protein